MDISKNFSVVVLVLCLVLSGTSCSEDDEALTDSGGTGTSSYSGTGSVTQGERQRLLQICFQMVSVWPD